MNYIGDFAEDSTVRIALTTNDGSGGAVAPSSAFEVADFRVYKNGSATQKTSDNGITITSPFDSVVGLHILEIDTSNDTGDSGFWTTGADYWVIAVPDETVDSQTVVQVVASFSIQNRYMRGTDSAATSAQATAIETDTQDIQSRLPAALVSGRIDASVGNMESNVITSSVIATGAITASAIQTNAITDDKLAASAITEIQSGLATTANITEIKGAGWSSATDTLEEIRDAVDGISGGGGTGTGARTVTITVDDGTNPLENARVRVTNGAETYVTNTNVSGVATFNLDDATWVVSITKPGYTFAGASLVVDGTEAVTYSMSLVVITPSSVDKVTGYWTVLDETGSAAASVVVTIKARQPLRGGAGLIHDAGERTAMSNGSGLVQFTNLIPGWRYAVVANDDYVADFVVPANAVTSVELGSIVARLP